MILLAPQTLNVNRPVERFHFSCDLRRGWHLLRIRLASQADHGIRKRGTVTIGDASGSFAWNDSLTDDIVIRLDRPAQQITMMLRHAQGAVDFKRFSIRRISKTRAVVRATTAKLKLLSQFNCLGPVLQRGSRLLLRGDLRGFSRKLMKGLPDSRVMRIETKRAEEAGASWWRRRSLSLEQRQAIEQQCDAIERPVPLAVILPVDATRLDHARQAAFSVLRQIYPHWQLRILWQGRQAPRKIESAIGHDARCSIDTGPFEESLQRCLSEVHCERVVVLSPDAELTEDALFRISALTDPTRFATHAVTLPSRSERNLEQIGSLSTAMSVLRWAQSRVTTTSNEPLVHPLDGGCETSLTLPLPTITRTLHLAANFTGISGWDAVAFQILRGLSRSGVRVMRHPQSLVKTHTLPPGLCFDESPRSADDPQLVIAAPFQVKQFLPDSKSAVFTMWECDRLPAASVKVLNEARVVIVPSRWGEEAFRASGVAVPIEVVPLGFDPFVYYPRGDVTQGPCVFGSAGALGAGGVRKNLTAVIAAFRAAFPSETDVRLRLKITPNCPPFDIPDDTRIEVTRAVMPANDVAEWNRSLSAFVNASFAEGFGLHLLEAMACGVPLISTAASGPESYFDGTVGLVVPHRTIPVKNDYYDGNWYEPDFDAMVESMKQVHRNRVQAFELGEAAAARARSLTWRDTGRKLSKVLADRL